MNRQLTAATIVVLTVWGVALFLIGMLAGFRLVDAWMAAR